MNLAVSSFLLSLCARWAAANVLPAREAITAAPVVPRQIAQDFIGWYSDSTAGTYSSFTCSPDYTWSQSGSYAACCSTAGDCAIATGCMSGSIVLYTDSSTLECTSTSGTWTYTYCVSAFIYQNFGDSNPANIDVFCGGVNSNFEFYRTSPPATTTTPSSPSINTITSSGAITPAPTRLSPSPSPTSKSSSSNAWIAGPVVGGVAAIALVILGIWIYLRKRNKKQGGAGGATPQMSPQPQYQPAPSAPMSPVSPYPPYNPVGSPYQSPPIPAQQPYDQTGVGGYWAPQQQDKPGAGVATYDPAGHDAPIPLEPGQPQPPRMFSHELDNTSVQR